MNTEKDYWKAVNLLFPKHRMADGWHEMYKKVPGGYCTDASLNGWGYCGCKRCQTILDLKAKGRLS